MVNDEGVCAPECSGNKISKGGLCCNPEKVNDHGYCHDTCKDPQDEITGGLCCKPGQVNENGKCKDIKGMFNRSSLILISSTPTVVCIRESTKPILFSK